MRALDNQLLGDQVFKHDNNLDVGGCCIANVATAAPAVADVDVTAEYAATAATAVAAVKLRLLLLGLLLLW